MTEKKEENCTATDDKVPPTIAVTAESEVEEEEQEDDESEKGWVLLHKILKKWKLFVLDCWVVLIHIFFLYVHF